MTEKSNHSRVKLVWLLFYILFIALVNVCHNVADLTILDSLIFL